jgi:glutathione peroxidase
MSAIESIPLKTIDGRDSSLGDYAGAVRLVVNVASKCGLTPQYEGLEELYENYRERGFEVLGFPANDFGGQEPGTEEEIQTFCATSYGVKFPMFGKIAVTGESTHPLYQGLIKAHPEVEGDSAGEFRERLSQHGLTPNPAPGILWNFEKFLIGRDGEVKARFAPSVAPEDPIIVEALERELNSN